MVSFHVACCSPAPACVPSIEAAVKQLGAEDGDAKLDAINKLVAAGDAGGDPDFKGDARRCPAAFNGRLVIVVDGNVTKMR